MTIIIDGTVGANKAVVLDANGKLPAIDGSLLTTLNATQVTTGTIATARLDTGTTNGKVLVLDGSGNMPAIAAGSMTGVSSATKSSSDPTVSTNPSTGLGTKWINTTSGEIFILTDATAGANVWTSTGGTSGNVNPWQFQGTQYGYTACGATPTNTNIIDRFSFTSDGNAVDVGDALVARQAYGGTSGETYGFWSGGSPQTDDIQKYQFVATANSTLVGDLVGGTRDANAGCSSTTHGYTVGAGGGAVQNAIEKYSHSSDGNSTDVGDLLMNVSYAAGCSDPVGGYGYAVGSTSSNVIQRFSFSSDGNSTDVGDLQANRSGQAGASSTTHGYGMGGDATSTPGTNVIERFAFAASGNASDVGDLLNSNWTYVGHSSTTHGYASGGYTGGSPITVNVIQKVAFGSSGNATDVGDMTTVRYYPAGSHF